MADADLTIASMRRGEPIGVSLDGVSRQAFAGETIAGLMLRSGPRAMRGTRIGNEPRGYFCGMGACQDCLVEADGRLVQACITYVTEGMRIATGLDRPGSSPHDH